MTTNTTGVVPATTSSALTPNYSQSTRNDLEHAPVHDNNVVELENVAVNRWQHSNSPITVSLSFGI